jgi:hypothetical protein
MDICIYMHIYIYIYIRVAGMMAHAYLLDSEDMGFCLVQSQLCSSLDVSPLASYLLVPNFIILIKMGMIGPIL